MYHPTNQSSRIIFRYFPTLSKRQHEQFDQIEPVYQYWNEKINLISRKDINHIYLKHVLHALSIAKVVTFKADTCVLDVGTGGGFPGIPLAIMFPQTRFYLVDSIGKKIRTVQNIVKTLGLTNVLLQQIRAEHIEGTYDFVLGRAVANLTTFYKWIRHAIACHAQHSIPNGVMYLKGEDDTLISLPHQIYTLRDFFNEPFFAAKQLVYIPHINNHHKSDSISGATA